MQMPMCSRCGKNVAVIFITKMDPNNKDGAYYTEDVSTKVVKIIQSYVGVVNKMVWRKG